MKRDATADNVGEKPEPMQEWVRDALRAEPPNFMRDVVRDAFNGISKSASMIPDRLRSEEKPRAPSGGSVEITAPAGLRYVDQLCDADARRQRAIAHQQAMELAWIEAKLERRNPHQAKISYNSFSNEAIWGDEDDGKR